MNCIPGLKTGDFFYILLTGLRKTYIFSEIP